MAQMGEMGCAPPFRPKQQAMHHCVTGGVLRTTLELTIRRGTTMSWMFITLQFHSRFTSLQWSLTRVGLALEEKRKHFYTHVCCAG